MCLLDYSASLNSTTDHLRFALSRCHRTYQPHGFLLATLCLVQVAARSRVLDRRLRGPAGISNEIVVHVDMMFRKLVLEQIFDLLHSLETLTELRTFLFERFLLVLLRMHLSWDTGSCRRLVSHAYLEPFLDFFCDHGVIDDIFVARLRQEGR